MIGQCFSQTPKDFKQNVPYFPMNCWTGKPQRLPNTSHCHYSWFPTETGEDSHTLWMQDIENKM